MILDWLAKKLLDSERFKERDFQIIKDLDLVRKNRIGHYEFDADGKYIVLLPEHTTDEQYTDVVDALGSLDLSALVLCADIEVNVISFK